MTSQTIEFAANQPANMIGEWRIIAPHVRNLIGMDFSITLDYLDAQKDVHSAHEDIIAFLQTAQENGLTATLLKHINLSPRASEWATQPFIFKEINTDMQDDFKNSYITLMRLEAAQEALSAHLNSAQQETLATALSDTTAKLMSQQPKHVLVWAFNTTAHPRALHKLEDVISANEASPTGYDPDLPFFLRRLVA